MNHDTAYFLAFSAFPGIGPVRFKLLTDYFGSAKTAWNASPSDLMAVGLSPKLVISLVAFRRQFDPAGYQRRLTQHHVSVLTVHDPRYPKLLKEIPDAPFVLYVKGKRMEEPLNLIRTIAVVGTRNITPYGREVTERLVLGLVAAGCTIVSGLAYGVDAAAHRATLNAGGKTIAVLGCGVDIAAPAANMDLYNEIARGGGAIVSEMPMGLRPDKRLFVVRNRIISGLSLGTVVVEGADDSGALITARYAAEQGREVFAVPGPITSVYSRGPARLLKNGATLATSSADILEALNLSAGNVSPKTATQDGSKVEQKILAAMAAGARHIDDLVRSSGLTTRQVSATITLLEIQGKILDYGEKTYGLAEMKT